MSAAGQCNYTSITQQHKIAAWVEIANIALVVEKTIAVIV